MTRPGTPEIAAVALVGVALLVSMVAPQPADAIPVFARKYNTSCQTCHVAFPKLNSFGEAFRRSGHRFPAGEEEDATIHEPVPLGHDAHKKVFPKTVWPGKVPGQVPLSVQAGSTIVITADDPVVSFDNLGGNVGLNFAGTLGPAFSMWAGAGIRASGSGQASAELERVFTVITPFEQPYLTLRLGRFEPGVLGFTMHRTLGFGPWILADPVADNGFTLDPTQLGFELTGVIGKGRLTYSLGLVEGASNAPNSPKDAYARVAVKLGGMRLDGIDGATESDPWRELSVQVGGFGYVGEALVGDPSVATQNDFFYIVGGDVNVMLRDLNIIAGSSYSRHRRPTLSAPDDAATAWHLFTQLDLVIAPWLVPTVRYEHKLVAGVNADRISGGVYLLLRANIRTQVLVDVETGDSGLAFKTAMVGINAAF